MAPKRVNLKEFLDQSSPKRQALDTAHFQRETIENEKFMKNIMYFHDTKYGYVHCYLAGPAFNNFVPLTRKVLPEWQETNTYMRFGQSFNADKGKQLVYLVFADDAFDYFAGLWWQKNVNDIETLTKY